MKKIVVAAVKALLGLILLLAVLLLAHPLWLAPAVKFAANSVVPGLTKTRFELGRLSLNAYDGRAAAGDLLLGNPEGYSESIALKVGAAEVVGDVADAMSDVIRLKEVVIRDVFVSYVSKDGVNNFDQISKNVSGPETESETVEPSAENSPARPDAKRVDGEGEKSKKVIIDRLSISGITVKFGPLPVPVPPITLTGVGEKSGGVTLMELGDQLLNAVMGAVGSVQDGLGALVPLVEGGADDFKKRIRKGDLKAVKDAADMLKSLFK